MFDQEFHCITQWQKDPRHLFWPKWKVTQWSKGISWKSRRSNQLDPLQERMTDDATGWWGWTLNQAVAGFESQTSSNLPSLVISECGWSASWMCRIHRSIELCTFAESQSACRCRSVCTYLCNLYCVRRFIQLNYLLLPNHPSRPPDNPTRRRTELEVTITDNWSYVHFTLQVDACVRIKHHKDKYLCTSSCPLQTKTLVFLLRTG